MDFFYRSVISPFAINLFLLPFTSHCSTQNVGFSDPGYVIKHPQPSSAIYGAPPFKGYLKCSCHLNQISFNSFSSNLNQILFEFPCNSFCVMGTSTMKQEQLLCIFWKWIRIRQPWPNLNNRVSLSFKLRGSCSEKVMRYGYYANGFQFDSHLVYFRFVLFFHFVQA